MAQWHKIEIQSENGQMTEAQAPVIVSASRSTDIPAFYADWFFHRLKVGYSAWTNPFNGVKSFVSFEKCRFIVFWSKNPKPLLAHLDKLNERNIGCCMVSKDIGEYNTCPHLCEYCYANASKETALRNWRQAKETEWKSETITGK